MRAGEAARAEWPCGIVAAACVCVMGDLCGTAAGAVSAVSRVGLCKGALMPLLSKFIAHKVSSWGDATVS